MAVKALTYEKEEREIVNVRSKRQKTEFKISWKKIWWL